MAFTPWPGLYTFWRGKMLKILSSAPTSYPRVQGEPLQGTSIPCAALDAADENKVPGLVVPMDEPGQPCGGGNRKGCAGAKEPAVGGQTGRQFGRVPPWVQGLPWFKAAKLRLQDSGGFVCPDLSRRPGMPRILTDFIRARVSVKSSEPAGKALHLHCVDNLQDAALFKGIVLGVGQGGLVKLPTDNVGTDISQLGAVGVSRRAK